MKSLIKKLLQSWPVLLLVLVEIILFKTNYKPGTWLVGWDSTQPELNFSVSISRNINAIWQEYRGLGLLDGMAHASNIIHTLFLYIISLFVKPNLIRYVFIFLMHFLGGLGAYYLARKLFGGKKNWQNKLSSFFVAIFYLLNPATMQMFFTPLEVFAVQFAFFPWLFLTLLNYLESGSRKKLLLFVIVNILALPQAHVPTVFIVYLIGLSFVLVFNLFRKDRLKRILLVILSVFFVNSFWGLPYIYSTKQNASVISNSKINTLSTPEVVFMNKSFGDIKNTILYRGFSLDYGDWQADGEFGFQLKEWRNHLYAFQSEIVGYVLFAFVVLGILFAIKKKNKNIPIVVTIFVFSLVNLASETWGLKYFRSLLEKIPYYSEIFRFSFTKFATIFTLSSSLLVGYALSLLLKRYKTIGVGLFAILFGGSIFLSTPAFKGEFFYDRIKLDIPNEYFKLFEFFNKEKNDGRIALLPQSSFWGWEYTSWGYRGSGFVWQGLSKPLLHRSFDPWSSQNETYYGEISTALERRNVKLFESILNKYQIKWILLDKNISQPDNRDTNIHLDDSIELIENSKNIEMVNNFGQISVYKTSIKTSGYVWSPESYKLVDSDTTYSKTDSIFSTQTAYIQDKEGVTYPFSNLDKRMGVEVKLSGEEIILTSNVLEYSGVKKLNFSEELNAKINNETKKVEVVVDPKEKILETFGSDRGFKNATNCDLKKLGSVEKEKVGSGVKYGAFDGGVSCDFFYYSQMDRRSGYILRIKGENISGRGLKIYLFNPETKRMDLEELLPEGKFDEYFFILPSNIISNTEETNLGYTLNVETRSFGRVSSENIIESIEIVEYPHNLLSKVRLESENSKEIKSNLEIINVEKTGTSNYKVTTKGEGLLVLGQGYEDGWRATIKGKKLDHKKVNSWQNGWMVPSGENEISIYFWPQYLEWGGLALLLLSPLFLASKSRKNTL